MKTTFKVLVCNNDFAGAKLVIFIVKNTRTRNYGDGGPMFQLALMDSAEKFGQCLHRHTFAPGNTA
jgi:hypothetical protein